MNRYDFPLGPLVEQYVASRRTLGRIYHYEQMTLVSVGRFLLRQNAAVRTR
jgi:integrase/recombinase XerD